MDVECFLCGHVFETLPEHDPDEVSIECPSCSAIIEPGQANCPICSEAIAVEMEEIIEEVIYCPTCSIQLSADTTQCPSCGTMFEMMQNGFVPSPEGVNGEPEEIDIQVDEPPIEEPAEEQPIEDEVPPPPPEDEPEVEPEPIAEPEHASAREDKLAEEASARDDKLAEDAVEDIPEESSAEPVEEDDGDIDCPSCGASLDASATECFLCNAEITAAQPDAEPEAPAEEVSTSEEKIVEEEAVPEEPPAAIGQDDDLPPAEEPVEEHMDCPKCGASIEANSTECFLCGSQFGLDDIPVVDVLPEEPAPAHPVDEIVEADVVEEVVEEPPADPIPGADAIQENRMKCPSCQSMIAIENEKCPDCWTDLSLYKACKECNSLLPVDATACPSCFAAVETPVEAPLFDETLPGTTVIDPDSPMSLEIEEVVVSQELEQEMTTLEQEDEMQRDCLVCGALLAEEDEFCPVCRIEYGMIIEEIPEPERVWEGLDIVIEPVSHQCPNCETTITGMEQSGREMQEQKWFFYGILSIFIGIFFTSFSVWLRGMTAESQSLGFRPLPLDAVVYAIGWILVILGFILWYMSMKLKNERLECPTCGIEITVEMNKCINCGTVFKEPEGEIEIIAEDQDVEALADEILQDEVIEVEVPEPVELAVEPPIPLKEDDQLVQEDLEAIEQEFGDEISEDEPVAEQEPVAEPEPTEDQPSPEEPPIEDEITLPEPEPAVEPEPDVEEPVQVPEEVEPEPAVEPEPVVEESDQVQEEDEPPAEEVPEPVPEIEVEDVPPPEEPAPPPEPDVPPEPEEPTEPEPIPAAEPEPLPSVEDTVEEVPPPPPEPVPVAEPEPVTVPEPPVPAPVEEDDDLGAELPTEHEEHKQCPGCGIFVDTSTEECPVCDTPFTDAGEIDVSVAGPTVEEVPPPEPEQVIDIPVDDDEFYECPSCNASLDKGTEECPICGHVASLDGLPPVEEAAVEPEFSVECLSCGAIIKERVKECPICEEELDY